MSDMLRFDQHPAHAGTTLRWAKPEHGAMIKLISTPIRKLLRFPLFQFGIVIFLILVMQAANEQSVLGEAFDALDKIVDSSVAGASAIFTVKSFTKSWLTFGFMIGYVYLACWLILSMARIGIRLLVDFMGRKNVFWLRSVIARERGIGAYRAWLPLEKIRPAQVPQQVWEETYAWPRDNKPPYPPFRRRVLRGIAAYIGLVLLIALLLQAFTPLPALAWLFDLLKRTTGF
jgi:hypothetical protein